MASIEARTSSLGRSTKKISSNRPLRKSSGGRLEISLLVAITNTGAVFSCIQTRKLPNTRAAVPASDRFELPNPDYRVPAGLRCQLKFIEGSDLSMATVDAASQAETAPVEVAVTEAATVAPEPVAETAAPVAGDPAMVDGRPEMAAAGEPAHAPEPEQASKGDLSNTGSIARAEAPETPSETAEPAAPTDAADAVESLISAVTTIEPVAESPAELPSPQTGRVVRPKRIAAA